MEEHVISKQVRIRIILLCLFLVSLLCYSQESEEILSNSLKINLNSNKMSGAGGFFRLMGGSLMLPGRTFQQLNESPSAQWYGWIFAIGYSTLYAGTALILGLRGARPALRPFLPIPEDKYYLAQSGFTVPVGTAAMGAGFGLSYMLAGVFGSNVEPAALWAAFTSAMVMPTVITMWIPETVGGLFAKTPTGFIPEWLDNWRQIIGLGWMTALSCFASAYTAGLTWWQSLLVGTFSTAVTGTVMIVFLR